MGGAFGRQQENEGEKSTIHRQKSFPFQKHSSGSKPLLRHLFFTQSSCSAIEIDIEIPYLIHTIQKHKLALVILLDTQSKTKEVFVTELHALKGGDLLFHPI